MSSGFARPRVRHVRITPTACAIDYYSLASFARSSYFLEYVCVTIQCLVLQYSASRAAVSSGRARRHHSLSHATTVVYPWLCVGTISGRAYLWKSDSGGLKAPEPTIVTARGQQSPYRLDPSIVLRERQRRMHL